MPEELSERLIRVDILFSRQVAREMVSHGKKIADQPQYSSALTTSFSYFVRIDDGGINALLRIVMPLLDQINGASINLSSRSHKAVGVHGDAP